MWIALTAISALVWGGYELFIKETPAEKAAKAADAVRAQEAAHATGGNFTARTPVQVGDIVTVAIVSTDNVSSETEVNTDGNRIPPIPTDSEMLIIDQLGATEKSGGTVRVQITRTGFLAPGGDGQGQPASIGILVHPGITSRLPLGFLNASVRQVERNGVVMP